MTTSTADEEVDKPKHGIAAAYYSSNGERYQPVMECLCGESWRESSWENVGAMLDEHLRRVL